MKNQYFGDQNDYFKYDLLIFLAEHLKAKKLSVVWMLTDKDKTQDGQKVDYKRRTGDRGLYSFLQKSLEEKKSRNVGKLGDYFQKAGYKFKYCPYGADELFLHRDRSSYFEKIPKDKFAGAVVFLDPDNGLEVRSTRKGNGNKYITSNEVKLIFNKMGKNSILVIYQHLPRLHRKLFFYRIAGR